MTKLLNTILVSATLLCFNNGYTIGRTMNYDPLQDINRTIFNQCDVVTDTNDIMNLGKIYFKSEHNTRKQYLIDEDGKYFFDLQTIVKNQNNDRIKDLLINGGWNLIVKNCDSDVSNTYTVTQNFSIPSNTNLIIPQGTTLTKRGKRIVFNNNTSNSTILILGNLLGNNQNNPFGGEAYSCIDIYNEGNNTAVNIIIGPGAKYIKNTNKAPIYPCNGNVNFVLYPQCTLSTNSTQDSLFTGRNDIIPTFKKGTTLFLNRFIEKSSNNDKLMGRAERKVSIVYHKNIEPSDLVTETDSYHYDSCTSTSYFKNFYWVGTQHKADDTGNEGKYAFENPAEPLAFISDDDGREVLKIDTTNDLAKYDAKLWNECALNGSYGFEKYNLQNNSGKYIDVDEAHKLFYGVENDNTTLEINTNKVYLGLIGNRSVKLATDKMKDVDDSEKEIVYLYGDNSNYTGTIIVPDCVKKVHLGEHSSVDISSNNELEYINE